MDVIIVLVCGIVGEILYGIICRKRFLGMVVAHAVNTCALTLVGFISVVFLKYAWNEAYSAYG